MKTRTINTVKTQGKNWFKKGGEVFHLPPERIQQVSKSLKRFQLGKALSNVSHRAWKKGEIRVYHLALAAGEPQSFRGQFRRDHLEDLLRYEPPKGGQSKQAFMAEALERLERNEHIYTFAEGGRLIYCGWLAEQASEIFLSEAGPRYPVPDNSAALYRFYTGPAAGEEDLFEQVLRQMLADVRESQASQQAYVFIPADQAAARLVVEGLGFEYQSSIIFTRFLGSVR